MTGSAEASPGGKSLADALDEIIVATGASAGGAFFRALVRSLGEALGVRCVIAAELACDDRLRTLAAVAGGEFTSFDYRIAGTPCGQVAAGAVVHYADHAAALFPADRPLAELDARSYLGAPMLDPDGDVLGVLAIIDDAPLPDATLARALLTLFASRCAAEIERMRADAALRQSESRYRLLVEDSFELVAEVADGRYLYTSPGYAEVLGYDDDELLGSVVQSLIHADDRRAVSAAIQEMAAGGGRSPRMIYRYQHKDGGWRWLESTVRVVRGGRAVGGGGVRGRSGRRLIIFSRDITKQRDAEDALRASEEQLRTVIASSTDSARRKLDEGSLRESHAMATALLNVPTYAAVLVDRGGTILALNETAVGRLHQHARALGKQPGESLVGACVFDLFPDDVRDARRARNEKVFETAQRGRYEDERDGVWTEYSIDPVFDDASTDGAENHEGGERQISRLAIFSRDITDRKRDEAHLRQYTQELEELNRELAQTMDELGRSREELREKSVQLEQLLAAAREHGRRDALTGVLNHGAVTELLGDLVAAGTLCAVAMVDVDGMKVANDTYGHRLGDAVLVAIVAAIADDPAGAIVGRYGGDEFLVVLPGADGDAAMAYADRARAVLSVARVAARESGAGIPVVASIGVASFPSDAATAADLIERADEAMYAEKKARREGAAPTLPAARASNADAGERAA